METLQITAKLLSGIAGGQDLAIDSIMAAAWMRRHYPDAYWGPRPTTADELIEDDLPLARIEAGNVWYYAASFAAWPAVTAEELTYWNKRVDQAELPRVDFDGRRGTIDIKSGRYKAFHMPLPIKTANEIRWWVKGDATEIISLLESITNIGKKKSQGWGNVSSWSVEPTSEDFSSYRDGKPTRPIPITSDAVGGIMFCGYRPPYWHPARQGICLQPDRSVLVF